MLESLLEVGLGFFTLYLVFIIGARFCRLGILFAIAGAIASLFLSYSCETCATWGFCIGMVFQFISEWREMLPVILLAAIGFVIGLAVRWLLHTIGANHLFVNWSVAWCMIACILLGSSWMSEAVSDMMKSSGGRRRPSSGNGTSQGSSYRESEEQKEDKVDISRYPDWGRCCSKCSYFGSNYCNYHGKQVYPNYFCSNYSYC